MSELFQQKDEAENLLETAREKFKNVSGLMKQGKSLLERVLETMREMIGSVEQNLFQGDRTKMVATVVGGMMIFLGLFFYLVFSKDE